MPIALKEYEYKLPKSQIAQHPIDPRDQSNLLTYSNGNVNHTKFTNLPDLFSESDLLVFNDTKVIPARIFFKRKTGAIIEVFLLEPVEPSHEVVVAMEAKGKSVWQCMIGNLKKWKDDEELEAQFGSIQLKAKLKDRAKRWVQFEWSPFEKPMVEVIQQSGKIPIPPYLEREAIEKDQSDYQTVYAKNDGAVAAPTAGLHFTEKVFDGLAAKGSKEAYVTLHVGAGTFQPVKEREDVTKHDMHSEQFMVSKSTVQKIYDALGNITVVGTTSCRTLESLFWIGNQLESNSEHIKPNVDKLEPYEKSNSIDPKKAIQNLLDYMVQNGLEQFHGTTEIMIMPGYKFKIVDRLITNFHQPGSTLMLLVAAFIGDDWKKVYNYALQNDFRFLSYGDSSILNKTV